jgi:hypothetical protein
MKATRFPTNVRLWEWIGLAVLAASWCIPFISIKNGPCFSIATALEELVAAIQRHNDSAMQLFRCVFIVFGSASVIVAIVLGWSLHCLVVIVRVRRGVFCSSCGKVAKTQGRIAPGPPLCSEH